MLGYEHRQTKDRPTKVDKRGMARTREDKHGLTVIEEEEWLNLPGNNVVSEAKQSMMRGLDHKHKDRTLQTQETTVGIGQIIQTTVETLQIIQTLKTTTETLQIIQTLETTMETLQ